MAIIKKSLTKKKYIVFFSAQEKKFFHDVILKPL